VFAELLLSALTRLSWVWYRVGGSAVGTNPFIPLDTNLLDVNHFSLLCHSVDQTLLCANSVTKHYGLCVSLGAKAYNSDGWLKSCAGCEGGYVLTTLVRMVRELFLCELTKQRLISGTTDSGLTALGLLSPRAKCARSDCCIYPHGAQDWESIFTTPPPDLYVKNGAVPPSEWTAGVATGTLLYSQSVRPTLPTLDPWLQCIRGRRVPAIMLSCTTAGFGLTLV
jgi:hypothetical protein